MREGPSVTLPINLGESGSLEVPPEASSIALRVCYAGGELGTVLATDPPFEWDWDRVVTRVVERVATPLRARVGLESFMSMALAAPTHERP